MNEKVICTNLLCKGTAFIAEVDINNPSTLQKITCPHCGNIGVMLTYHVLNSDEIVRQIKTWENKVLYKNAFKAINYKKLPKTIEQQSIRSERKTTKPVKV